MNHANRQKKVRITGFYVTLGDKQRLIPKREGTSIEKDGVVRVNTSGAELFDELTITIEAVDVAVGLIIRRSDVDVSVVGVHFHHVDTR